MQTLQKRIELIGEDITKLKVDAIVNAAKTVSEFLENNPSITKVYFVCFEKENYEIHKTMINGL